MVPGFHGVDPGAAGLRMISRDMGAGAESNCAERGLPTAGRGVCADTVAVVLKGTTLWIVPPAAATAGLGGATPQLGSAGCREQVAGITSEGGERLAVRAGSVAKKSPRTRCFGSSCPAGGDGSRRRLLPRASEDIFCVM